MDNFLKSLYFEVCADGCIVKPIVESNFFAHFDLRCAWKNLIKVFKKSFKGIKWIG